MFQPLAQHCMHDMHMHCAIQQSGLDQTHVILQLDRVNLLSIRVVVLLVVISHGRILNRNRALEMMLHACFFSCRSSIITWLRLNILAMARTCSTNLNPYVQDNFRFYCILNRDPMRRLRAHFFNTVAFPRSGCKFATWTYRTLQTTCPVPGPYWFMVTGKIT